MNDSNNVADTAPWVLNDQPNEEIGEVKERTIDLQSMLEGQESSEQPTELDRDDPGNYANSQPWVIFPRFDSAEDDESYLTIDDDGRIYADNAPWVIQEGESSSATTDSQTQTPQVRERETVIIKEPETEENYITIGDD